MSDASSPQVSRTSSRSALLVILVIVGVSILVLSVALVVSPSHDQAKSPDQRTITVRIDSSLHSEKADASEWYYTENEDEMGEGKNQLAQISSKNTVDLPFPYNGSQSAWIVVRSSKRLGKDVIFNIQRGQIVLPYGEERVRVRFDDEPSSWYSVNKSADHSSNILFFANYKSTVRKMLDSRVMRVEVNLYQAGNRVFEFQVAGLRWKRP